MKRGWIIAILFIAGNVIQAQDTTLTGIVPVGSSGMITWQEVVKVEDADKGKLYNKGIEWINVYFPNSASVTRKRSPESGIIEGYYSIRLTDEVNDKKVPSKTITFTFSLEFKDGRFRYTFTNFNLKTSSKYPLERWLDKDGSFYSLDNKPYLIQIKDYMDTMIASMIGYISKPDAPKEEEW